MKRLRAAAVPAEWERITDCMKGSAYADFAAELAAVSGPERAARHVRHYMDHLALAGVGPSGLRLLDAGCGAGLGALVYALFGAEAHGLELDEQMVAAVNAATSCLPGVSLTVEHGDVAAMPYPDEHFDFVLSEEAISHYPDVPAFLCEAHRVLRPGGILFVSDGNNSLNPRIRRRVIDAWEADEWGPRGRKIVNGHGAQVVVEHPMLEWREEIIAKHSPELTPAEAHWLALRTAGMCSPHIESAVDRYRRTGVMVSSTYHRGDTAIRPIDGVPYEQLFNPYRLARQIGRLGFKSRVVGHWGGANGKMSVRLADAVLSLATPLTIFIAHGFLLIARKR